MRAKLKIEDARRLLLAGAALLDDPAGKSIASRNPARRIDQLGFVQIDSINVVERAHELILHARSDAYRPGDIFSAVQRGQAFEHWTHDASVIRADWFPHWRHRFERSKRRGWHLRLLGDQAADIVAAVRDRIRTEGPLMSRDFEQAGHRSSGWWNWKPAKAALEYLWRTGELAVAGRRNFQKVYDLTERVLPKSCALPTPEWPDHVEWACAEALTRLGIATPKELAHFLIAISTADARAWVDANLRSGRLIPVEVAGRASVAFADVRRRIARLPDAPTRIRLLAPFDPLVRDRARAERLFNFAYRFEAFVPQAKRVHGYYVLPILRADQLIGRVNPKLDRKSGTLRIGVLGWQPGVRETAKLRSELHAAAERLANFIGAKHIELSRSTASPPTNPP
jgi:uncharacterized protein YcaQ